ncbi:MAG: DUF2530 domain-containing protein [Streptomycetaceae bacterium]|nr:DUF2530 domain-containing protein [Streptomycetaceae bacterium]
MESSEAETYAPEDPANDPGPDDSGQAPDVPHPGPAKRPTPEPLEADDIKIVGLGTVVWFVLFLISLPFRDTLDRNDHEWWPWCALAGAGLGLLGLWYLRRRREAMRRRASG